MSATCPTCGPTTAEQHPREAAVTRCANCKEWLTVLCPECAQGKTVNCVGQAMHPDSDDLVACGEPAVTCRPTCRCQCGQSGCGCRERPKPFEPARGQS